MALLTAQTKVLWNKRNHPFTATTFYTKNLSAKLTLNLLFKLLSAFRAHFRNLFSLFSHQLAWCKLRVNRYIFVLVPSLRNWSSLSPIWSWISASWSSNSYKVLGFIILIFSLYLFVISIIFSEVSMSRMTYIHTVLRNQQGNSFDSLERLLIYCLIDGINKQDCKLFLALIKKKIMNKNFIQYYCWSFSELKLYKKERFTQ